MANPCIDCGTPHTADHSCEPLSTWTGLRDCPLCGALMTKEHDAINEPVLRTGVDSLTRATRPATFWSCGSCEWCEEV